MEKKVKKEKAEKEKPKGEEKNENGGFPDVDLKKFLGCGG